MKKETVFTSDPNFSFLSYFLLVSSTQSLKQKHRGFHLQLLNWSLWWVYSTSYICPKLMPFLSQLFNSDLNIFFLFTSFHFPCSLVQPHSNVSSSLLSKVTFNIININILIPCSESFGVTLTFSSDFYNTSHYLNFYSQSYNLTKCFLDFNMSFLQHECDKCSCLQAFEHDVLLTWAPFSSLDF